MSKLYYSEQGNVLPSLCEELNHYRRARKILHLPESREPASLYVLARAWPDSLDPLRVAVNGTELPELAADTRFDNYCWYSLPVLPSLLRSGANQVELWTDAQTMDSWALAMEIGHRDPDSYVSSDAGQTWRNEKMGYLNLSRGEYVVRMRLAEGEDPAPPAMVWEDPADPRLSALREILPREALSGESTQDRVRSLCSWVCTRWPIQTANEGVVYTPWDAQTIFSWGSKGKGHNGLTPIAYCVHYAIALSSCCAAAGIPARGAAVTDLISGDGGHFVTEVWFENLGKWVMVDPTVDAILVRDGLPMSIKEIQAAAPDLADYFQWGPGYDFQLQQPLYQVFTGGPGVERALLPAPVSVAAGGLPVPPGTGASGPRLGGLQRDGSGVGAAGPGTRFWYVPLFRRSRLFRSTAAGVSGRVTYSGFV